MVNSRAKGARAERALCEAIREAMKWVCRRSQQYCGAGQTADILIEGMPQLHIESKMVEALSVHPVMERAVQEAGTKYAVLCHKRKRTGWLVTVRMEDWLEISKLVAASGQRSESDGT